MPNPLVKVCSFPRSGTNYLLELLQRNFYADQDVSEQPGQTGHWSRRIVVPRPAGKLFFTHVYLTDPAPILQARGFAGCIYLYRDGRDVCVSLYRSKLFLSRQHGALSFSKFLRTRLDWGESPGKIGGRRRRRRPPGSWHSHVLHHTRRWATKKHYVFVRYEDALLEPDRILQEIAQAFGLARSQLASVHELVGPEPHAGPHIGRWREHFSDDDLRYFYDIVPRGSPFLWHGATDSDTEISSAPATTGTDG